MKYDITKLPGSEWHKGDMNRYYIDINEICEMYFDLDDEKKSHGRIPMNRSERQNAKAWIDLDTNEIKVKGCDACVIDCINELYAALTEETEEIEETEAPVWYAILLDAEDNDWGTGSRNIAEAVEMARRCNAYAIAVIADNHDPECKDLIFPDDYDDYANRAR